MRTSRLASVRDTGMLRLYALVMVIAAGLAVVGALRVTETAPRYSAAAEVVLSPTITRSGTFIQPSMPTEQRLATSTDVVSNAAGRVGVPISRVAKSMSATVPVDTQVLVLTYTADSPVEALSGARALAASYLQARNPKNGKNAVASLVSPPEMPTEPVKTNYPVVLGAAILGGLLTGFAVARAWDRVRGRVRTIADAEQCAELDALALTPNLPSRSFDGERRRWAGRSQIDAVAARILGGVERENGSTVLVTGAASACGSTAVAASTALALERMGRLVVLVTADDGVVSRLSRDGRARRGIEGLSTDAWSDALRAGHEGGLRLVPVAEWDREGVAAARLTNLLPDLQHRLPQALILIDGPPAWDSAGIALHVDEIALVVGLGRCSRRSTAMAAQVLDQGADKLMGLVITPRRGLVRRGLVGARAWASRQARRIRFRIASPSVASVPAPAPRSRSGTIATAPVWKDSTVVNLPRSSLAKSDRGRDATRPDLPQTSDGPTRSVVS